MAVTYSDSGVVECTSMSLPRLNHSHKARSMSRTRPSMHVVRSVGMVRSLFPLLLVCLVAGLMSTSIMVIGMRSRVIGSYSNLMAKKLYSSSNPPVERMRSQIVNQQMKNIQLQPSEEETVLLESASKLAASIVPRLDTVDTFDQRSPVWFTSENPLTHFDVRKTWSSPDAMDSFRLAAQRVADKKYKKQPAHLYVNRCTLDPSLRLFPMLQDEAVTRRNLYSVDEEFRLAQMVQKRPGRRYPEGRWMGLPTGDPKYPEADFFADDFCTYLTRHTPYHPAYAGWRNPFDQNEIMLCSPAGMECTGGYVCDAPAILRLAGADGGAARKYSIASVYEGEEPRDDRKPSNRFNFIALPLAQPLRGLDFDQRQALDIAHTLFGETCVAEATLRIVGLSLSAPAPMVKAAAPQASSSSSSGGSAAAAAASEAPPFKLTMRKPVAPTRPTADDPRIQLLLARILYLFGQSSITGEQRDALKERIFTSPGLLAAANMHLKSAAAQTATLDAALVKAAKAPPVASSETAVGPSLASGGASSSSSSHTHSAGIVIGPSSPPAVAISKTPSAPVAVAVPPSRPIASTPSLLTPGSALQAGASRARADPNYHQPIRLLLSRAAALWNQQKLTPDERGRLKDAIVALNPQLLQLATTLSTVDQIPQLDLQLIKFAKSI